ncbi:hypothetical protein E0H35_20135 [Rhizobium leguminosarum bv. viciae]|uniref:hypothetical protein n=1 Tax=Rhizobium TaxID=379 RepID=UPI0010303A9B|nr:hypothetical protein [Rhizobium leguminosarum]MBY5344868.1 hypothetical protein [Rhizobium leguminosarum]MBY5427470.1 hypothetical protein [Rhizobium leguminosarum]NKK52425.1 hypothetical protein [Rhizobium leguminosarum bv. viciae]QIO70032.1 hypothetical protein HA462_33630 [Rhizobium leguminosarum bv. trifolii]TBF22559.1 hypothetical protein ELG92_36815 [Rhizobium leguminosarum]
MNRFGSFSLAGLSFSAMMAIGGAAQIAWAAETAPSVPTAFPLGIVCWNAQNQVWGTGYLATIEKEGTATYMPLGGKLSAKVNANGMVEPPKNRPMAFDCFGKTIDELRAMGRVIELQTKR